MSTVQSLVAFTSVAAVLTATPGLDTALVLRTAAVEGSRRAMLAATGIALGCFAWALAVGLGLGALLAASQLAYDLLRWAGAIYLLVLGWRLIHAPRQTFEMADGSQAECLGPPPNWLLRGFLTNLLNPKVGLFYVSFLPQFIPAGANVPLWSVLLAAIHNVLGIAWFGLLVGATRPLAAILQRRAVIAWLDRLTGGLLMAFAFKLAFDARQ